MRAILLAMLVAAGVGLSAPAKVSAAPISGLAIGGAATAADTVQQAQHTRWRSHRRWGSRGRLCHTRSWSRWRRC
jgi:hypothetical protein